MQSLNVAGMQCLNGAGMQSLNGAGKHSRLLTLTSVWCFAVPSLHSGQAGQPEGHVIRCV